jgi:hypothetical protein
MSDEREPLSDEREPRPFQELLREAQQGSKEAAKELYETYVKYVLRCVRQRMYHKLRPRFDSQDFVQQVWASFFVGDAKLPDFETPEELAFLRAHHCDEAQGYYFSRPVPADQFAKLLEFGIPKAAVAA